MAFTCAAAAVTFAAGLALALGLGDLIISLLPKPGRTLKYSLIIAAGCVLAAGGAIVWFRRKALAGHAPSPESSSRSHGSAVILGAGVAGVELLTAFPYFAAIAMIVGSSVAVPGKVFLIALYCVVYTLPLIAIAVVCVVKGRRAEALLRPTVVGCSSAGRCWWHRLRRAWVSAWWSTGSSASADVTDAHPDLVM